MLEDRIEASQTESKERLREIENQMFVDGCLLTELKWKGNDLQHGNQSRVEKKKPNRRTPTHRYNTRYAAGLTGSMSEETKEGMGRMNERIRRVEARIDGARREIGKINSKITKTLALAPQMADLADRLSTHQEAQADISRVLHAELAEVKATLESSLEDHVQNQAIVIGSLQQQILNLYGYAANLQDAGTFSTTPYPTPAPSPKPRRIAAL
jgi:uncharacterized phage infection (PIP) family protein YhgE